MTSNDVHARGTWVVVIAGTDSPTASVAATPRRNGGAEVKRPSAYRIHSGARSMLQRTVDRALQLVPRDRVVTVALASNRRYLEEALGGPPPGPLLEEPRDCGSVAPMLLALVHVLEREPEATVIMMPASHTVHPEDRFLRIVAGASELAQRAPDRIVVLGAVPHDSEAAAEWIQLPRAGADGLADPAGDGVRAGGSANDRADPGLGTHRHDGLLPEHAMRQGWLRNTNIVVVRAATLWRIAQDLAPDTVRPFATLRRVVRLALDGTVPQGLADDALARIYQNMGRADFNTDILHRATESVLALSLEGILWSDWSRPVQARAEWRAGSPHPGRT